MENIVCNGAKTPISISGLKAMPIHHIYLKNISIQTNGNIEIENAENISQENINIIKEIWGGTYIWKNLLLYLWP